MKLLALFLLINTIPVYAMGLNEITTIAIERSSSLSAQEMESHALQSERNLRGKWTNPQIMGQFGSLKSGT
jgi:hypothetical protein